MSLLLSLTTVCSANELAELTTEHGHVVPDRSTGKPKATIPENLHSEWTVTFLDIRITCHGPLSAG